MFRIAVIENQQTQFVKIVDNLKKSELDCEIKCETTEDYLEFINEVKIFLNPRYKFGQNRKRQDAFKRIIEVVQDCDVLLIDHKLSGMHVGDTGIVLAQGIYKELKRKIPVIFLSRTNRNDKIVREQLEGFIDCLKNINSQAGRCEENRDWIWVEKGYFDGVLLDSGYFCKYVVDGIKKMYRKTLVDTKISILLGCDIECRDKKLLNEFEKNLKQIIEMKELVKIEKVWEMLNKLPDNTYSIEKKHLKNFNAQYKQFF